MPGAAPVTDASASATSATAGVSSPVLRIAAKAPLLTRLSWSPPVLVGSRLYVRDRATMMAVELG